MTTYFARRLIFASFLVFAVSSASLLLVRLAPGDYVTESLGVGADPSAAERARAYYGLDQPIGLQYRAWLWNAARFDFGRSMAYDRPVADLVPERAANTAILAAAALVVGTLLGLPLGVLSGSTRSRIITAMVRAVSVLLVSMPPLLTSLFLVFVAAITGWFPIGGMQSPTAASSQLADRLEHMAVPVLALALPLAASFERLQGQSVSETIQQPFIVAALARGVPRRRVIWRDALKASLRPVASVYGLVIGSLLSGSFAVEMITAWPGLGRLMLDAMRARDLYLVAGCAAAGSLFLAAGTLLSDAALTLVEPRVRDG
jgi:peptide/nickel transport system permease protein